MQLNAASATDVKADLSGPGEVKIGQVRGKLEADMSGPAHIIVAHGDVSNADLQISGTGGFRLDSGAIGRLHVDSSGVASVHIGGTVGDADVKLSGVGSVHIAKLTGKLDKDVSGVGDVSVGEMGEHSLYARPNYAENRRGSGWVVHTVSIAVGMGNNDT